METDGGNVITRLEIHPATRKYAESFGAKYREDVGWYVSGHVPYQLEEFVIRSLRVRSHSVTVSCPNCGGQMQLMRGRKGGEFWGCMLFPRCTGKKWINQVAEDSIRPAAELVKGMFAKKVEVSPRPIIELALRTLGSEVAVKRWLNTPKISLDGKMPIDIWQSQAGQEKLVELLRKIND